MAFPFPIPIPAHQVGLCHTLSTLSWHEADSLEFYPRAFDLSDKLERTAFLEDARRCAAEAVLKRALEDGAVGSSSSGAKGSGASAVGSTAVTGTEGGCMVELATLRLALKACLSRLAGECALVFDDGDEKCGGDDGKGDAEAEGAGEPSSPTRTAAASAAERGRRASTANKDPVSELHLPKRACGPLTNEEWDSLLKHR